MILLNFLRLPLVNLNIPDQIEPKFFDFTKFSSLTKVYRILTCVIKFCYNARNIVCDSTKLGVILALKLMQKDSFPNEFSFLKNTPK